GLLALVLLVGARALARSIYERRPLPAFRAGRKGERSVLIAGAGDGGRLVLREILRNRGLGLVPVGFLDDDPRKRRLRIDGVPVRGHSDGERPPTARACASTRRAICRASSTMRSPTKPSLRSPPPLAPRARASCASAGSG